MTEEEIVFLENAARNITIWDVTESHVNENGTVIYDSDYWKDRVATQPSLDKNDPKISPIIAGLFQRLKPIVEELNREQIMAKFFIIDVDSEIEMAQDFGIRSIPTFIIIKDNKEVRRVTGAKTKEELLSLMTGE